MNTEHVQLQSRSQRPWPQGGMQNQPTPMRVSLAYVEHRVNLYLRFGQPVSERVLDPWRRVTTFAPGAVCCRVKWLGNDFGTAMWQVMVLQAPTPWEDMQRIGGVLPGACILLRADGDVRVKAVLAAIDAIEQIGIDLCAVATTYWRTVGNRLAARLPLPTYTAERHAAYLARGVLG